jgi:hypothetical protein
MESRQPGDATTAIEPVRTGAPMTQIAVVLALVLPLSLLASGFACAADDSKVKAATEQIERGAKQIPTSNIGKGVEETAKGIGNTVSEGAKYSGEKLQEAGKAAEPPAKTAWGSARDSAVGFGRSVKGFFANLFSK